MNFGRLVHQLVHHQGKKITEHDFGNRTHTGHRRAHCQAGNRRFRNRSIANPLRTESIEQPPRELVHAAGYSNVFPHDEDAGISRHFLMHRLIDRLGKCNLPAFSRSRHALRPHQDLGRQLPFRTPQLG